MSFSKNPQTSRFWFKEDSFCHITDICDVIVDRDMTSLIIFLMGSHNFDRAIYCHLAKYLESREVEKMARASSSDFLTSLIIACLP